MCYTCFIRLIETTTKGETIIMPIESMKDFIIRTIREEDDFALYGDEGEMREVFSNDWVPRFHKKDLNDIDCIKYAYNDGMITHNHIGLCMSKIWSNLF